MTDGTIEKWYDEHGALARAAEGKPAAGKARKVCKGVAKLDFGPRGVRDIDAAHELFGALPFGAEVLKVTAEWRLP